MQYLVLLENLLPTAQFEDRIHELNHPIGQNVKRNHFRLIKLGIKDNNMNES